MTDMVRLILGSSISLATGACGVIETASPDAAADPDALAAVDTSTADAVATCDLRARFGVPVVLSGLARGDLDEVTPRLTPDERTLFFHGVFDGVSSDLAVATRAARDLAFDAPHVVTGVNSNSQEYEPSISPDGLTLLFHSDRGGSNRLYQATRPSTVSDFGPPVLLGGNLAEEASEDVSASFAHDGAHLWFASNRVPARSYDLYQGRLAGAAVVDVVAASVNTTGWETAAAPSGDGLAVYFTTQRAGGLGGHDIWVAYRDDASAPFGEATAVSELNSAATEESGWLSTDGCRYYFSSDRNGNADLFVAERAP